MTAEILHRLELRQMEQTCPRCGLTEAAGWYCTQCARPTDPSEWYGNSEVATRHARQDAAGHVRPPARDRSRRSA